MTPPSLPSIDLSNVGLLRHGRWILRGINWRVPAGVCAAILGPNGSGKSTLARILAAHLWPSTGDCRVLARYFGEADLPELRRSIRLVQPTGPYDLDNELTVREAVLTGFFGSLALYETPTVAMQVEAQGVLTQIGLSGVADQRYTTLSSGERARCLIGRALVRRPRLLLLDEPTAGLDVLAREQVLATIQQLFDTGRAPPTVVLITHHVEELPPVTSQILLLNHGEVAATGSPADVLQTQVLTGVYGVPIRVAVEGGRYYLHVHPEAWRNLLCRP